MQALREAEDANLELSGDKRLSWAAFRRSRALESTGTGTILSARRSRFFASASRRAGLMLRREERRRTTVAFLRSPQTQQGRYLSSRLPFKLTKTFLWKEFLHNLAVHFASISETLKSQFLLVGKSGKAFVEDAGAQRSRRRPSGAVRNSAPVVGGFRQEPRFGEHCYRHNAQCAKKPLLRLREPESAAAAET
ncbi:unnamed protein product [Coccothraustes coccothraustes]